MYDEILALWKRGNINDVAIYLNRHGIYSTTNTHQKDVVGRYWWERRLSYGVERFDMVVMGVMVFFAEDRVPPKPYWLDAIPKP